MSDSPVHNIATPSGKYAVLGIFAVSSVIGLFLALQLGNASLYEGEYHPAGNDAFYHARRIIDTAGERGFYEFDDKIHAPEGSQIVWPWAFDFTLGKALGVWQVANPEAHPMHFLAMIPPFWLILNVALFVALTGAVGLSTGLRAIASLCYALFPFTQLMHGTGAIDHHFIEHTFVLASTLLAITWARQFSDRGTAIALGIVLGLAPAFHSGLFILQLPVLLGLGLLWLKGETFDHTAALRFSIALTVTTLISALPSAPLRDGVFDFSLLSWFHVYVAACTSVMTVLMSRMKHSGKALGRAFALASVLAVPILLVSATGLAFIRGDILLLDRIEEAQSPVQMMLTERGVGLLPKLYSSLFYLAPLLLIWYTVLAARSQSAATVMFGVAAAFGLALLSAQIRLQYFGSFALLIGLPLLLQHYLPAMRSHELVATFVALIIVFIAWQKPLNDQLFAGQNLSFDIEYELGVDLFPVLADACANTPGIALATNNMGHPVRYHSECSVIANNFLLTTQHEEKIRELNALWAMQPDELALKRPDVRFVLVILSDVYLKTDSGLREPTMRELASVNPRLAMSLVFNENLPESFELLAERRLDDGRDFAFARLFRINPPPVMTGDL